MREKRYTQLLKNLSNVSADWIFCSYFFLLIRDFGAYILCVKKIRLHFQHEKKTYADAGKQQTLSSQKEIDSILVIVLPSEYPKI